MTETLFRRTQHNPILGPSHRWWESRAVLNPGTIRHDGRVALVYRAVGGDGVSRFGLAWSTDGERVDERRDLPFYEAPLDDPFARLGVEDPRVTFLNGRYHLTYCKVSVDHAEEPPLTWEVAPFRLRSGIGVTTDWLTMREIGVVLPGVNTKDAVLFPELIDGRYAALVREFPSIYYTTSEDLVTWSKPVLLMEPISGTWEAERIGAGPPPIRTEWGWLLLYHGNQFLRLPANQRLYRMGLALLDLNDPGGVLYRHPAPIFSPEEPYEREGPVGNVVFGTGLVEIGDRFFLYYGAGDGVIGAAVAEKEDLYRLVRRALI